MYVFEIHTFLIFQDGVWSNWGSWSLCSVTCGEGNKTRDRVCEQKYGGRHCAGSIVDVQLCTAIECPPSKTFLL